MLLLSVLPLLLVQNIDLANIAIAIGPKCLDIKVGDHVYFDVGQEFKYENTDYVVMREPHILGVLE